MTEQEVLAFAGGSLKSVWALEVLLLLRRTRERCWREDELVRELRSSSVGVRDALANLLRVGFAAEEPAGQFCYRPTAPELDTAAAELSSLFAAKPMVVIRAIATAPNEKLRIFSDAFRLKDQ